MLHHQLAQELAVEPVQVVDRVEQAVARPDAEKQRDFAEPRLQVDDDRRPLAEPRQLDAAVHRDRRRAGAALGAEEHERRGRGLRALRRLAARGRPAHGAVERFLGRRPGEELVGARRASTAGSGRDRRPARRRRCRRPAAPARSRSMRRHRRRRVAAGVDDDEVRRRTSRSAQLVQHADRNRARRAAGGPKCFLNSSSSVTMRPTSCAMADATALSAWMPTVSSRARPVSSSLRPRASPAPSTAFSWSSLSAAACFFSASSRRRSSSPCLRRLRLRRLGGARRLRLPWPSRRLPAARAPASGAFATQLRSRRRSSAGAAAGVVLVAPASGASPSDHGPRRWRFERRHSGRGIARRRRWSARRAPAVAVATGDDRRRQRSRPGSGTAAPADRAPSSAAAAACTARSCRGSVDGHARASCSAESRRDHHDQLGLVLLRRLALEQQAEDRDVADAGNLLQRRVHRVVHQAGDGERLAVRSARARSRCGACSARECGSRCSTTALAKSSVLTSGRTFRCTRLPLTIGVKFRRTPNSLY